SSDELKARLIRSLGVMLKFYGFKLTETEVIGVKIIKSDEYQDRKPNWLSIGNHNFLRLTRILTSLRTLGLENYAQALFICLDQVYVEEKSIIGVETYSYWKNAA
ncbi:MAG: opioid growth factor receptor-related protein, partial [Pyrinomonadaceae bacterium]